MSVELDQLLGEVVAEPVRPAGLTGDHVWQQPHGYRPHNEPRIPSAGLKPQTLTEIPPHLAARAREVLPDVSRERLRNLPIVPGVESLPAKGTRRIARDPAPSPAPGRGPTTRGKVSARPWAQAANENKARAVIEHPEMALGRLCALLRADPSRVWTTAELGAAAGRVRYGVYRQWMTLKPNLVRMALSPAVKRGWVRLARIHPDRAAIGVQWLGFPEERR